MEIIDAHIAIKIAEAQKLKLQEIQNDCTAEINYIKEVCNKIISESLDSILKDPFKNYIVIPVKNYNVFSSNKLFVSTFKDYYMKAFNHSLHMTKEGYLFLMQSHKFINNHSDSRPLNVEVINPESPVDEPPSMIFTQNEIKKFADRETAPKKTTQTTVRVDSKLVPLFLQRRQSKTIPPSLDSSREPSVNS